MDWTIKTVIAKHYLLIDNEKVTAYEHKKANIMVPMQDMKIKPMDILSMEEWGDGDIGEVLLDMRTDKVGIIKYYGE